MWLGLNVGSDIALANAMAREIIHAGLAHDEFIARAHDRTSTRTARASSRTRSSSRERRRACPATSSARPRIAYAKADAAMICWTLGITEHHNAVDNVLALINLALLTGHVGR